MNLCRLLVLIPLFLLAACSSTEFVNLPEGTQSECDTRLIGSWKVVTVSDSKEQDEPDYLTIEADCKRFVGSSMEDGTPEAEDLQEDTDIQFVRDGKTQYVAVREIKSSAESNSNDGDNMNYTLYRYEFKKNRVELRGVDHERIGELIQSGKLHGRSVLNAPSTGQRTIQNQVDSNSNELSRGLRDRKVFEKRPTMILERISDDDLRAVFTRAKGKTGD